MFSTCLTIICPTSPKASTTLMLRLPAALGRPSDSVHSVISEVGKAGAGQIRLAKDTVLDEKKARPKKKPKAAPKRKTTRAKTRAKRKSHARKKS